MSSILHPDKASGQCSEIEGEFLNLPFKSISKAYSGTW